MYPDLCTPLNSRVRYLCALYDIARMTMTLACSPEGVGMFAHGNFRRWGLRAERQHDDPDASFGQNYNKPLSLSHSISLSLSLSLSLALSLSLSLSRLFLFICCFSLSLSL